MTPPPKPPRLLPFALLAGFLGLCALAVVGHVDMTESATASLVGVILGGMLQMLHQVIKYYYPDDKARKDDDEP